jgi:hypothetical protein
MVIVADTVTCRVLCGSAPIFPGPQYEPPYTDELWLDITCPEVLNITRKILDLAVTKGCDGVRSRRVVSRKHARPWDGLAASRAGGPSGVCGCAPSVPKGAGAAIRCGTTDLRRRRPT